MPSNIKRLKAAGARLDRTSLMLKEAREILNGFDKPLKSNKYTSKTERLQSKLKKHRKKFSITKR